MRSIFNCIENVWDLNVHIAWKMSKYGVFFWSVFSRIRTEYGQIRSISLYRSISPYSVQLRENTDQKKLLIWTFFPQCQCCVPATICSPEGSSISKNHEIRYAVIILCCCVIARIFWPHRIHFAMFTLGENIVRSSCIEVSSCLEVVL